MSGVKDGEGIRYNEDGTIMVSIEYQSGTEVKVDGFKIKYETADDESDEG